MTTRFTRLFSAALDKLPAPLSINTEKLWQEFTAENNIDYFPDKIAETLPRVWACSEFVARNCIRYPDMLQELIESEDIFSELSATQIYAQLDSQLQGVGSETELLTVLRTFRRYQMVRIIWRDLAGWTELTEVTRELSALADACIALALDKLFAWQCERSGTPMYVDPDGNNTVQQMLVMAMGKLGARELNLSSDVDLIFIYPAEGEIASSSLSHAEFFKRLSQSLINALQQSTADGFVFRVDMRLRPFGDGGAIAASLNAVEQYYQIHGREWERYAMVKARVLTGNEQDRKYLMSMLRPFVYRRYLDYSAYESMREMKAMIVQEVKRKGLQNNVKLGAGGIREVEFIGQVFQLIRGGRETDLQERRILIILLFLKAKNLLPEYVIDQLIEAYIFLRNTEHRIQAYQDKQLHTLPDDEVGQLRLAMSMGYANWQMFYSQLSVHRSNVRSHFKQVFEAPQSEQSHDEQAEDISSVWQDTLDKEKALQLLSQAGYQDAENALQQITYLRNSRDYQTRTSLEQQRMDQLLPLLIGAVGQVAQPEETLKRVLNLITNIARRSVYLALLIENPLALSQLARLYSFSPWVARYLTQTPVLLDELLDARSLYAPPDKKELVAICRQRIANLRSDDEEQAAEAVRHFKHTSVLKVAAADLAGALPLMDVSNHLTWIGETVLDETLEQAWRHMVTKHGRPVCSSDGEVCDKGFAIIGYGKLGGYELGYGSDLDLVFLHGAQSDHAMTSGINETGKGEVSNAQFFARLGQRLIHLLTVLTPAGVLYEIDMRLRPDGASGMLVSNLKAFEQYQQNKAWLWEHQALVRARAISGDPLIIHAFNKIRYDILTQQRDHSSLRKDVVQMREKMRKALAAKKDNNPASGFDLKQGHGGIVDIEFIVQYGVLAWAHQYPELTTYTDNYRILDSFAQSNIMPAADITLLTEAYLTYRGRLHRLALQETSGQVADNEYVEIRTAVQDIWQKLLLID